MATIWFDLDGTIYDLYGVENWLEKLRSSDTTPYENGSALVDLAELENVLEELGEDYEIGVITWLAMGASKEYDKAVRKVKKEWVKNNFRIAKKLHVVKYGTPKHSFASEGDILVDDNKEVRKAWEKTGNKTIDTTKNILKLLAQVAQV